MEYRWINRDDTGLARALIRRGWSFAAGPDGRPPAMKKRHGLPPPKRSRLGFAQAGKGVSVLLERVAR